MTGAAFFSAFGFGFGFAADGVAGAGVFRGGGGREASQALMDSSMLAAFSGFPAMTFVVSFGSFAR